MNKRLIPWLCALAALGCVAAHRQATLTREERVLAEARWCEVLAHALSPVRGGPTPVEVRRACEEHARERLNVPLPI